MGKVTYKKRTAGKIMHWIQKNFKRFGLLVASTNGEWWSSPDPETCTGFGVLVSNITQPIKQGWWGRLVWKRILKKPERTRNLFVAQIFSFSEDNCTITQFGHRGDAVVRKLADALAKELDLRVTVDVDNTKDRWGSRITDDLSPFHPWFS